jgi:hypothetical protein
MSVSSDIHFRVPLIVAIIAIGYRYQVCGAGVFQQSPNGGDDE